MNATHATILLIEDEPQMRRFLRGSLGTHGYKILEATTGEEGLAHAASQNPDVVLLDLGLPDLDGLEVTRRLREWMALPIIVLSARGQDEDKVRALDAGADDYLTKPFSVAELLARIRVALRHAGQAGSGAEESSLEVGELCIDFSKRRVFVSAEEVHLTPTEYKLLSVLARHAGRVITHRQLLKEVWGTHYVEHTEYLRVFVGQLRQKLEATPSRPRYLLNEPGVGYRLKVD